MTESIDRGRVGERPDRGLRAEIRVERGRDFTLDLSLTIEPKTTVALLGPNGAGKSTTVEVLAGLTPLDGGRLQLGNRTLDDPATGRFVQPEHRRIGVVFQDYLLFDHLSVLDNVGFGPSTRRRAGGRGRRRAEVEAMAWLDRLGLADLARQRPDGLSGGQRQRVALARALAADPDMILLDEPLAALDVATRTRLRRLLIDHLSDFAGPRLLITHEPSDAFTMADHIHIIEGGRATQSGTIDEIRRRPATPYVAALTGTNFLTGINRHGTIMVDGSDFELRTADTTDGQVQVVVPPRAVSLYRQRPDGSPRNTWATVIDWLEPLGETTRIQLGAPLPLLADITPAAASALGLAPGDAIWAVVKATEVTATATEVTAKAVEVTASEVTAEAGSGRPLDL